MSDAVESPVGQRSSFPKTVSPAMYTHELNQRVKDVLCYLENATQHLEGERALAVKNEIIRKVGACIEQGASSEKRKQTIVAGSAYWYTKAVPVKRPRQSPAEPKETLALMFKPKVLKSPLQNGRCEPPIKETPLSKKTLFPEM